MPTPVQSIGDEIEVIGIARGVDGSNARPPNKINTTKGTKPATKFGKASKGWAKRSFPAENISCMESNCRTAIAWRLDFGTRDVAPPSTIAGSNRGSAEQYDIQRHFRESPRCP